MKKLHLLLIWVFVSLMAQAQFVGVSEGEIDTSNILHIGDNLKYINIQGADNFSPGDTGTFVIWDFSGRNEYPDSLEIYDYIDTTGTHAGHYAPNYTDMSEIMNADTNAYFYYDIADGTEWNRSGFYAYDASQDLTYGINYSNPVQLVTYPLQKGVEYSQNYDGSGYWSLGSSVTNENATVENGTYQLDADAYGILILPDTVFKNAVRVHVQESFDLNLNMYGSPAITVNINDDFYYWYAPGMKNYVARYGLSTTTSKGTEQTYYLSWTKPDLHQITPDFTVNVNDTLITTADSVLFINLSSPIKNSTFSWSASPSTYEFRGGTDSSSQNPYFKFNAPGYYDITLTVTNPDYPEQSVTKHQYIHVQSAPHIVADFHADQTIVNVNSTVSLINDTYIMPDSTTPPSTTTYTWMVSPPTGWNWNFSDEHSENPQIYFTSAGCYSIMLIATDDSFDDPDDTLTRYNYINVGGGCGDAYNANFTVTDASSGDAISGASVDINSVTYYTDNQGQVSVPLYNGTYNYTVSKTGYQTYNGSVTISDADVDVTVQLEQAPSQITEQNKELKIYPNPTSGNLNIVTVRPSDIYIFSSTGQLVYNGKCDETLQLDLSDFNKGLYFLKVSNENYTKTTKIIVR